MSINTLIFPCSGAADVGELADRTARKLSKDGDGKIFCLAGVGGAIPSFIEKTKTAESILVIDGCPQDCGRKTLAREGITDIMHARLTDLGYAKGGTNISVANIDECANKCKDVLCS